MADNHSTSVNAGRAILETAIVIIVMMYGLYAIAYTVSPYVATYGTMFGVAAVFVLIKFQRATLSAIGFKSANSVLSSVFAVSFLLFTAYALFILFEPFLESVFGEVDLSVFALLEGNAGLYVVFLTVSWIPAAFGEEVIYRGFIQTRLAQVFGQSAGGWVLAIIAQAVIFGLTHSYQGTTGMIEVTLYGLAAGVMYVLVGRSIWPLVLAHGLVDTVVVTDFYLGGEITDLLSFWS